MGQAIGMSLSGLKPVCEIQFEGFIYPAMNQIVTQAAKITTRWNDDIALNLVIRVPVGGGHPRRRASQRIERGVLRAHTRSACRVSVLLPPMPPRC